MGYGKVPPFPFLKPGFLKRKRGNKLEPKAVPCFYIGPPPNRPRDSMRVMLRSGAMIGCRHATWACVPSITSVPDFPVGSMLGRGRKGSKTAELRSEEGGGACWRGVRRKQEGPSGRLVRGERL